MAIAEELSNLPPVRVFAPEYVEPEHPSTVEDLNITVRSVCMIEGAWMERLLNSVNFSDYESRCTLTACFRTSGVFERLEEMEYRKATRSAFYDLEFEYKK